MNVIFLKTLNHKFPDQDKNSSLELPFNAESSVKNDPPEPEHKPFLFKVSNLWNWVNYRICRFRTRCFLAIKKLKKAIIDPVVFYYNQSIGNVLIGKLVALSFRLQREDFQVFVKFEGHVHLLRVRVRIGGWENGKEVEVIRGKTPGHTARAISIREMKEAIRVVKSLSLLNKRLSGPLM